MNRLRPAVAAACLAAFLFAALPTSAAAHRDAQQFSATVSAEPWGDSFFGSLWTWGQGALGWLQAIVAPEHGTIVLNPVAPPNP